MLEKWKSSVDRGSLFGDCLSHELLIAKLHACRVSLNTVRLIHSYLRLIHSKTEFSSYADDNTP